ncbi:hypothetical protein B0H16DRAFT_1749888 [Mycena metata]|uniref:GATA-type domain-containing protein n=1 Tax=Mycena metata TaxID=1033252 RepID=A0AAD7DRD1_9AGAR|nr:hypothetical protein B0H16DRAFT_1749888 [Mycena metata]
MSVRIAVISVIVSYCTFPAADFISMAPLWSLLDWAPSIGPPSVFDAALNLLALSLAGSNWQHIGPVSGRPNLLVCTPGRLQFFPNIDSTAAICTTANSEHVTMMDANISESDGAVFSTQVSDEFEALYARAEIEKAELAENRRRKADKKQKSIQRRLALLDAGGTDLSFPTIRRRGRSQKTPTEAEPGRRTGAVGAGGSSRLEQNESERQLRLGRSCNIPELVRTTDDSQWRPPKRPTAACTLDDPSPTTEQQSPRQNRSAKLHEMPRAVDDVEAKVPEGPIARRGRSHQVSVYASNNLAASTAADNLAHGPEDETEGIIGRGAAADLGVVRMCTGTLDVVPRSVLPIANPAVGMDLAVDGDGDLGEQDVDESRGSLSVDTPTRKGGHGRRAEWYILLPVLSRGRPCRQISPHPSRVPSGDGPEDSPKLESGDPEERRSLAFESTVPLVDDDHDKQTLDPGVSPLQESNPLPTDERGGQTTPGVGGGVPPTNPGNPLPRAVPNNERERRCEVMPLRQSRRLQKRAAPTAPAAIPSKQSSSAAQSEPSSGALGPPQKRRRFESNAPECDAGVQIQGLEPRRAVDSSGGIEAGGTSSIEDHPALELVPDPFDEHSSYVPNTSEGPAPEASPSRRTQQPADSRGSSPLRRQALGFDQDITLDRSSALDPIRLPRLFDFSSLLSSEAHGPDLDQRPPHIPNIEELPASSVIDVALEASLDPGRLPQLPHFLPFLSSKAYGPHPDGHPSHNLEEPASALEISAGVIDPALLEDSSFLADEDGLDIQASYVSNPSEVPDPVAFDSNDLLLNPPLLDESARDLITSAPVDLALLAASSSPSPPLVDHLPTPLNPNPPTPSHSTDTTSDSGRAQPPAARKLLTCNNCRSTTRVKKWKESELTPGWTVCDPCRSYEKKHKTHRPLDSKGKKGEARAKSPPGARCPQCLSTNTSPSHWCHSFYTEASTNSTA